MTSLRLNFQGARIELSYFTNLFYIITINFIGGISYIIHAYGTLNFKKAIIKTDTTVIEEEEEENKLPNELNPKAAIAGFIALIPSIWFLLLSMVHLKVIVGPDFYSIKIKTLYFSIFLVYALFAILPIILVAKNIEFNNRIRKQKEVKKLKAYHRSKMNKRP